MGEVDNVSVVVIFVVGLNEQWKVGFVVVFVQKAGFGKYG